MDRLRTNFPIALHWRSFELRPKGSPPIPPAYLARIEATRPQLYATARTQYGLELNSGPFGIDSHDALVGAKYAEAQGQGALYHQLVFRAYWQEARDISDRAELAALAGAAGLDGDAFRAALDDPALDALVAADIAQAHAYGLDAVPAVVLDNRYLVMGAQPYAVFEQAVKQALAERAA